MDVLAGGRVSEVTVTPGPASPLGTWLRRLRWPVIALWVLVVVAAAPFAGSLAKATNGTAVAFLPTSSQSVPPICGCCLGRSTRQLSR